MGTKHRTLKQFFFFSFQTRRPKTPAATFMTQTFYITLIDYLWSSTDVVPLAETDYILNINYFLDMCVTTLLSRNQIECVFSSLAWEMKLELLELWEIRQSNLLWNPTQSSASLQTRNRSTPCITENYWRLTIRDYE